MKKILFSLILSLLFIPNIFASTASVRLTTSSTSVIRNNNRTINVVIDASSRVRGGQFKLALNNSNFEIVSVVGANGLTVSSNSGLYLAYKVEAGYSIPSGSSIATITVKAKGSINSTSLLTISDVKVTLDDSYDSVSVASKSVTLKVIDTPTVVPKSSNNYLESLSSEFVSFEFDKEILEYDLSVSNSVLSLDLDAVTEDSKASVQIQGDSNFVLGENVVKVVVTAENGSKKTYTLNVTRASLNNNYLKSITFEGIEFEFDKDVLNYNLELKDVTVTELDIEYELEDPNADIQVIGNENLSFGKNVIKVIVTSDNDETRTYTFVVDKIDPNAIITDKESFEDWMLILLGLMFVTIIVQLVIIFKRKK